MSSPLELDKVAVSSVVGVEQQTVGVPRPELERNGDSTISLVTKSSVVVPGPLMVPSPLVVPSALVVRSPLGGDSIEFFGTSFGTKIGTRFSSFLQLILIE